jgi:hypothetical protein
LHKVAGLHEQSDAGRRYGDLTRAFAAALGGEDALDESVRMAIRRAAELTVAAEQKRAALLRGDPVDSLMLIRLENAANRAVKALRLDEHEHKPKRDGLSLSDILMGRANA